MPKVPRLTASKVERVLFKLGFKLSRQKGSHRIYKHQTGKRAMIPFHGSKTLHPKVVSKIIKDAGLTVEEFIELI